MVIITNQSVYRGSVGKKKYQALRDNYHSALPSLRNFVVKCLVFGECDVLALEGAKREIDGYYIEVGPCSE